VGGEIIDRGKLCLFKLLSAVTGYALLWKRLEEVHTRAPLHFVTVLFADESFPSRKYLLGPSSPSSGARIGNGLSVSQVVGSFLTVFLYLSSSSRGVRPLTSQALFGRVWGRGGGGCSRVGRGARKRD